MRMTASWSGSERTYRIQVSGAKMRPNGEPPRIITQTGAAGRRRSFEQRPISLSIVPPRAQANGKISASLVVAEIFPMEQFRPRMKKGENADALLASIQYYTLLRLHEVVRARSYEALCMSIAADLGDKVLSKEYAERSD